MSFSPFAWIRQQARDSFLAGIQDGLAVVTTGEDTPPDLAALRAKLAPVPPALPELEEPAKKRGK